MFSTHNHGDMEKGLLDKLYATSLRVNMLREWQKSNSVEVNKLDDRQVLLLQLINEFKDVNERAICVIFGLRYGSSSHLVKRLTEQGYIEKEVGRGGKLSLTKRGEEMVEQIRAFSDARFEAIFSRMESAEKNALVVILDYVDGIIRGQVAQTFFGAPLGSTIQK
jgi:DNA-binding MarR family transcriptional regulator